MNQRPNTQDVSGTSRTLLYPTGQRNVDQERLLIKTFAHGLTSDELARKLVEQANPANIEEAITAVTRFCERQDAYKRLGRQEEPMEVGVMRERPFENALPLATMINSLSATVAKLATKVAKIEINSQPEPRTPTALRDARYEAPFVSVKRACDWSVTAPRRAVRVSEARMGLVNGRDALPSRSRNSCPALQ